MSDIKFNIQIKGLDSVTNNEIAISVTPDFFPDDNELLRIIKNTQTKIAEELKNQRPKK